MIIGLTNKSKKEFADKDDSLKALAERFPLTLKVEWDRYTKTNFLKLFKTVFGNETYNENSNKLSELANIVDLNNAQGVTFVSPRTAVSAAQLYMMGKKLDYISEIDPEILKKYKQQQVEAEFSHLHKQLLTDIEAYIEEYELETIDQSEDFLEQLNEMAAEIGDKTIENDFITSVSKQDKEIKLNKTKFLLDIINRVNAQGKMYNDFVSLKQRLNEIIKLVANEQIEAEKTEAI